MPPPPPVSGATAARWRIPGIAFHADLPCQRLDRHDAAPAIVPLHVSPLLPFREVVDPAPRVTDPEGPLLQAKQRQEPGSCSTTPSRDGLPGHRRWAVISTLPRPGGKGSLVADLVAPGQFEIML
jgi:hypothetical protein